MVVGTFHAYLAFASVNRNAGNAGEIQEFKTGTATDSAAMAMQSDKARWLAYHEVKALAA